MAPNTSERGGEHQAEQEHLLVDRIIEALPAASRASLDFFSLPHWIDDAVLERLPKRKDAMIGLAELSDLGLIERWNDGAQAVHGWVRRYVLERMAAGGLKRFRRLSGVFADSFAKVAENGGDVFHHIESVFHRFAADPARATELLIADGIAWKSEPLNAFEALARLIAAAHEQKQRGFLTPRAQDALALLEIYLPSPAKSALEEEKILEALRVRTPGGDVFDAELSLRLGRNRITRGRTHEARELLETALKQFRALRLRRGEADALRMLGRAALREDDLVVARNYFEQAHAVFLALDLPMSGAQCVKSLAETAFYLGRFNPAEKLFGKALKGFAATDGSLGEANTRVVYAQLLAAQAQFSLAQTHISLASDIYVAVDNRLGTGNCLKNSGVVLFEAERYAEARKKLAEAEDAYAVWGSASGDANCKLWTAACLTREAQPEAAVPLLNAALAIFSSTGDRFGQASVRREQGIALAVRGDLADAICMLDQAEREFAVVGNKVEALGAAVARGAAVVSAGFPPPHNLARVKSVATRARRAFAKIGYRRHLREAEALLQSLERPRSANG